MKILAGCPVFYPFDNTPIVLNRQVALSFGPLWNRQIIIPGLTDEVYNINFKSF